MDASPRWSEADDHARCLDLVVATKVAQMDVVARSWAGVDEIRAAFRSELSEQVRRLHDLALARSFRDGFRMLGAPAAAYRNSWLGLGDGDWALAGIRFRGLDPDRPFVDLVAQARPLVVAADLVGYAQTVAEPYTTFRPRHVRTFVVPSRFDGLERLPDGAFVERLYLAAPLVLLRSRPTPPAATRVTVRRLEDLDVAERFRGEHARYQVIHPEHVEYAHAANLDELAHYLAEGSLFEVRVDDKAAGVIAGFRAAAAGMAGFEVGEIFLYEGFRGRGLGAPAQRAFIDALQGEGHEILFGTIDSRNRAAVRTAQRCGRVVVGCHVWLPVPP